MKVKMLGHIKNLLRKWVETPDEDQAAPAVTTVPAARRKIVMTPLPEAAPSPTPGNGGHHNGRGIELPMQPILAGLPLELQARLRNPDAGALTICIPLEKILAQLSRGSVKIHFGELRQAAPDLFTPEEDWDGVMVPLPLGEVLTRLNPALITRRRVQKKVEVPADISSPFDQRNQGLIFSVGPTKPESVPAGMPPQRQAAPAPVTPAARGGLTFTPTPLPPGVAAPSAPAVSSAPRSLPLRELIPNRPPSQPTPAAPTFPAPVAAVPASARSRTSPSRCWSA